MSTDSGDQDQKFSFVVTTEPVVLDDDTYEAGDAEVRPDGKRIDTVKQRLGFGERKVGVEKKNVQDFLHKQLVPLGSTIATEAKAMEGGLRVDEISLTIGIGAEGGVSFVAKASAQAAITVTLRRST
jgi:hypothetical protein